MLKRQIVDMEIEDKKFKEKWQKDKEKEHIRVTIFSKAAEFVGTRAYNDFGLGQSSISLEISKLILIAQNCIENEPEAWQRIIERIESEQGK